MRVLAGDIIATDNDGISSLFNLGDIAWTLTSTALVWIMIPGLGFLYSGLLRRKNALTQMYMGIMVLAAISFQVRIKHIVETVIDWIYVVVLLGFLISIQFHWQHVHRRPQFVFLRQKIMSD